MRFYSTPSQDYTTILQCCSWQSLLCFFQCAHKILTVCILHFITISPNIKPYSKKNFGMEVHTKLPSIWNVIRDRDEGKRWRPIQRTMWTALIIKSCVVVYLALCVLDAIVVSSRDLSNMASDGSVEMLAMWIAWHYNIVLLDNHYTRV